MQATLQASNLGYLLDTGRLFVDTLVFSTGMAAAARQAVPRLGDWCAVQHVGGEGELLCVAVAARGPATDRSVRPVVETFHAGKGAAESYTASLAGRDMQAVQRVPIQSRGAFRGYLLLGDRGAGSESPEQSLLAGEFARCIAFGLGALWQEVLAGRMESSLQAAAEGRERAETALRESEARAERTLDHFHDAVVSTSPSGEQLSLNRAGARQMGRASQGNLPATLSELMSACEVRDQDGLPFDLAGLPAAFPSAKGRPGTKLLSTRNPVSGRMRWWEVRSAPQLDAQGGLIRNHFCAHDVTRARATEARLAKARTARDLLQQTVDALPDRIGVFDPEARLLLANRGLIAVMGVDVLVDAGRSPIQGLPAHLECFDEAGVPLPFSRMPFMRALDGEARPRAILRVRNRDTGEERWADVNAVAIRDVKERLALVVHASHDVTSLKREIAALAAETMALQERDREAATQRWELIGRLVGGIAHDFNNLLLAIGGFADLLAGEVDRNPVALEYAWEIKRSWERGAKLTRQLLAYGRRQVLVPRRCDLNEILASMAEMLGQLIWNRVHLVTLPGRGLLPVKVDSGKLEQAVLQLILNARDAMPHGGQVILQTLDKVLDRPEPSVDATVPSGRYSVIEVADNGQGIPPEDQARVFNPFFTTKAGGHSSGMGLSTVHGFITQSGGFVQLESEPGKGSVFRLLLPALAA